MIILTIAKKKAKTKQPSQVMKLSKKAKSNQSVTEYRHSRNKHAQQEKKNNKQETNIAVFFGFLFFLGLGGQTLVRRGGPAARQRATPITGAERRSWRGRRKRTSQEHQKR